MSIVEIPLWKTIMSDEERKSKESKILFLEKAIWKKGREIITVLLTDENGRRHSVAHIYFEQGKDKHQKRFVVCDAKGNELFSSMDNLHQLKRKLIEIEPELKRDLKLRQLENARKKDDDKGISR